MNFFKTVYGAEQAGELDVGVAVAETDEEAAELDQEGRQLHDETLTDLALVSEGTQVAETVAELADAVELIVPEGEEISPEVRAIATVASKFIDPDANPSEVLGDIALDTDVADEVAAQEEFGRKVTKAAALEGIKDTIASFWKTIKELAAKIIRNVKEFFYKFFGQFPRMKKRFQAIKEKLKELNTTNKTPEYKEIELTSGTAWLRLGETEYARGFGDVKSGLTQIKSVVESFTKTDVGGITKLLDSVAETMGKIKLEDGDDVAATVVELQNRVSKSVVGGSTLNKARLAQELTIGLDPKRKVFCSETMLGGKVVILPNYELDEETGIRVFRDAKMSMTSVKFSKDVAKEVKFEAMNVSGMIELCDVVISLIDAIERCRTGKGQQDREKAVDKLQKAGDELSKRIAKAEDGKGVAQAKSLLEFTTTAAHNFSEPVSSLARYVADVAVSVASLISKNMSNYKAPKSA